MSLPTVSCGAIEKRILMDAFSSFIHSWCSFAQCLQCGFIIICMSLPPCASLWIVMSFSALGTTCPICSSVSKRVGYDSKSTLLSFNFATSRTESSSSFSAYHAFHQSVPINIKAKMDDMFKCQAAISVENRTRACNHIMISMDRQNMHSLRAIITW